MIGRFAVAGLAAELAAELQPRHPGQHPVEQDEIGRSFGDQDLGLVAVVRLLDREPGTLEVVGEQLLQWRFVLDHEDHRLHGVATGCTPAAGWGMRLIRWPCTM